MPGRAAAGRLPGTSSLDLREPRRDVRLVRRLVHREQRRRPRAAAVRPRQRLDRHAAARDRARLRPHRDPGPREGLISALRALALSKLELSDDNVHGISRSSVLPKSEHSPPSSVEGLVHRSVSCHVSLELRAPVRLVSPGNGPMLWAAVPEAAIDEDCHPPTWKCDIDANPPSGRDDWVVASESLSTAMEKRTQLSFGPCISSLVRSHCRASGRGRRVRIIFRRREGRESGHR